MWILTSIWETGPGCGSPQEPLAPPPGPEGKGSPSGGGEPGVPGPSGVGRGVGCGAAPIGAIGISGAGVAAGLVGRSSWVALQAPAPSTDTPSTISTPRRTARPWRVMTRSQRHTPPGACQGEGLPARGYLVTWTLPQTPFSAQASKRPLL